MPLILTAGPNLAAVRNDDGEWEVMQFLSAVLTAPATYTLTSASPSAVYTAAEQTADFGAPQPSIALRLYQISATRGRGIAREAVV